MSEELLIVVPTRERPQKVHDLIVEWRKTTSGNSKLLFCVDDDDSQNYFFPIDVSVCVRPRMRLGPWLNYIAAEYETDAEFIGFMGDDHRPRTQDFDAKIVEPLRDDLGVAYGNDLLQGPNLATAVFMNTQIVKQMGIFCPPGCIHLYLDNYWMALGMALRSLHYRPDVVIEHLHYINGKAETDRLYLEVNSPEVSDHDRVEFERFMQEDFANYFGRIIR